MKNHATRVINAKPTLNTQLSRKSESRGNSQNGIGMATPSGPDSTKGFLINTSTSSISGITQKIES